MDLTNPWISSALSAVLIAVVTYVWAQFTDKQQPSRQAASSFVIAIFSLSLVTWIAHGHTGAVMTDPFPMH